MSMEFHLGTIFDTSIYTTNIFGNPTHYIFKHIPTTGEPLEDVIVGSYRFAAPYDTFSGHLYVASPFETEIYIEFSDGERIHFRGIDRSPRVAGNLPHGYIPENLYNRDEILHDTGRTHSTGIHYRPHLSDFNHNELRNSNLLIAVVIFIIFFLMYRLFNRKN